jgi:hypothetical protein
MAGTARRPKQTVAVFQFYIPCDPGCPEVQEFVEKLFTGAAEIIEEGSLVLVMNEFESEHIMSCERCATFGTQHVSKAQPVN